MVVRRATDQEDGDHPEDDSEPGRDRRPLTDGDAEHGRHDGGKDCGDRRDHVHRRLSESGVHLDHAEHAQHAAANSVDHGLPRKRAGERHEGEQH